MMDFKGIKFPYFPANIETRKPLGTISLYEYLYAIKNPKPHVKQLFKEIEKASLAGDKKLKAELKAKTFYFTPPVALDGKGRSYENIVSWNPIMLIDVDNLDVEYAKELKKHLFETHKFIIACFLSASKKGVKALVHIPRSQSVEEFKSYYYGLMDEFQNYKNIDFSSKNSILPNYLTYDEDLLYRLDAEVWDKKGIQVDEFQEYEGEFEIKAVSGEDLRQIKTIITRMFNNITDSGHLILRSASLLLGGYCAGYGLNIDEMRDFLFDLIEDTPYLHKSLSTYKKTASDMLLRGTKAPLHISKDE